MGLHEQVVGSGVHLEGAAGLKTGENGGKRGKNGGKRGRCIAGGKLGGDTARIQCRGENKDLRHVAVERVQGGSSCEVPTDP